MHIKGAGAEHAAKRRALTPDEVKALVLAIEPRYRAMVVLSATCGLRYGEALGLQRQDLTLDAQLPHLTLRRTIVEVPNTEPTVGPLKAREEGETRTVPVPSGLVPILQKHLTQFVDPVDTSSSVAGKRHVSSCSPAPSPPNYGAVGKEREGGRTAV
jgi:integrase